MITEKEINFTYLCDNSWSGAKDTVQRVLEEGKEDELMSLLDEIFEGRATDTQINDFLWFESDYIYKYLNISDEEEEEEEGEEEGENV